MRVLPVLFLATLQLAAGGFDGLWRYAHPDAQFLCGLEWSSIASSELAATLKSELAASKGKFHGMEFVKELDRVLISTPGKQEWPGMNRPTETPLILVIQGKFDWPLLRQRSLVRRYKSVEWLAPKNTRDEMQIGVINPQTLLLGDRKSLAAAIDRGLGPAAANRSLLFESATALSASHSLWFVANSPSRLTSVSGPAARVANDIRAIAGGVQFQNGLTLGIDLKTGQPEQAARLLTLIQAMMTLQQASTGEPAPASLLRRIKVTQSGSAVHLDLAMTTREIQDALRSAKSGLSSGAWLSAAASMRSAQHGKAFGSMPDRTTAKPPEKQVIRIVGLDSGTREIPFGN